MTVLTKPGHSGMSGQCISLKMLAGEHPTRNRHVRKWSAHAQPVRMAAFINKKIVHALMHVFSMCKTKLIVDVTLSTRYGNTKWFYTYKCNCFVLVNVLSTRQILQKVLGFI